MIKDKEQEQSIIFLKSKENKNLCSVFCDQYFIKFIVEGKLLLKRIGKMIAYKTEHNCTGLPPRKNLSFTFLSSVRLISCVIEWKFETNSFISKALQLTISKEETI